MHLTDYELEQLRAIRRWEAEIPGWGTRLLAKPGGAAAKAVQALVPVSALRAALQGLNGMALRMRGHKVILRRAKVDSLEALRALPLERCDAVALGEMKRAMAIAGGSGAVFGLAGALGLVADVPTLLTLGLRAVHRTALSYGEDLGGPQGQRLAIGIFALASANSMDEKQAALRALRGDGEILDAAWRDGVERVAEREMAKEAAVFSLQTLASRIGLQLGRRKAAGVIPVVGAAVGASVNAWYLRDLSQAARLVFQERWLTAKYKKLPALGRAMETVTGAIAPTE
ncbi:MAG TPA: EcsC family protein [Solimonas sp.]|nr:EcsC family protein [Solimonas sp.]